MSKCTCGCPHCCGASDFPHVVIDVSAWQEGINMAQVKAEGIYGVIVKLGENYRETETARKQIFEALDAGLKVGVYYYSHAMSVEEARAEGEWFNKKLAEIGLVDYHLQLGAWFDCEHRPFLDNANAQEITDAIMAFIGEIKNIHCVGVYGSYSMLWDETYMLSQHADIPVWSAQYNDTDDYAPYHNKMWQFTDSYPCAGFNVDANKLYY